MSGISEIRMTQHDDYGKKLLRSIAGPAYINSGPTITVDYGAGLGARIDGVVGGEIAVEIESRVSKQIRGAILDLFFHSCAKKLLVILPVHADNPDLTKTQCENILSRLMNPSNYRVVITRGSGDNERLEEDKIIIGMALTELGFDPSA